MRKLTLFGAALSLAALAVYGGSSRAQQSSSTVPVYMVDTAIRQYFSASSAIAKEDVTVFANNTRQNVTSWVPAQGNNSGLQLAILIDDADSPAAIGQHFNELRGFITSQPDTTQVGLFYARSGAAQTVAPFDANHQAVAGKLRLPLGRFASTSPSIYLSLQDLVKHWPADGMRHEVLVIASGVDFLQPGVQDTYLDSALDHVQQGGVVVHTIYTGGPRLADASFRQSIAWQNLVRVSGESGGQSFFQGFETPVNFVPILRQLNAVLHNQYLLTFDAPHPRNAKGELRTVQIRTEQRNIKLSYPSRIFVSVSGTSAD